MFLTAFARGGEGEGKRLFAEWKKIDCGRQEDKYIYIRWYDIVEENR